MGKISAISRQLINLAFIGIFAKKTYLTQTQLQKALLTTSYCQYEFVTSNRYGKSRQNKNDFIIAV